MDQPTEDVLKASAEVERARAQVAEARHAHMAAAERHRSAEEHLAHTLSALQDAVRAKALADMKGSTDAFSSEAFKLRFSRPDLVSTARDAIRAHLAGQAAATSRFLGDSAATARATELMARVHDVRIPLLVHTRGVPVSAQVRELFRTNPHISFNATDVQRLLDLPAEKESVVRQNLRRLTEAEFIIREERGLYRLNPEPHAPPPIEDD